MGWRRWVIGIVALLICIFPSVAFASEQLRVIVNGKEVQFDVQPQIVDGRIMIPLRFVAQALGAQVNWDSQNNIAEINSQPTEMTLTEEEWRARLTTTIKRQLPTILNNNSLSNYDKAIKIAELIQDNLSYAPPQNLIFPHYCFIQYLFARQQMLLALDKAESAIDETAKFSQATAIFNFNRGIADGSYKQFEVYLNY